MQAGVAITMLLELVLVASLFAVADLEEKRWVWEDKKHNTKLARYEVINDDDDYRPPGGFARPAQGPTFRPGGQTGGGYGLVKHPLKQVGVITGPNPSWSRPRPLLNFDRCKCAEKFNCNTPGISYGHCDEGKQYCCYSSKVQNAHGEPLDIRPVANIGRPKPGYGLNDGVLTGPTERPQYGGRPSYYQQNGVLVGPIDAPYSPGLHPRTTAN